MYYKSIIAIVIIIFIKGVLTYTKTSIFNAISKKGNQENEKVYINKYIEKIILNPRKYIVAINTLSFILIMILGVAVYELLYNELYSNILKNAYFFITEEYTRIIKLLSGLLLIIITSYFTMLFGNIIPKRMANSNKKRYKISNIIVFFIYFIYYLLFVIVKLLYLAAAIYAKIFGGNVSLDEDVTEEKILMMIDEGEETGTIDENEKEMISNIFDFNNKTAEDICTHRKDIVALSIDSDFGEVINIIAAEKYSRIPIYKDNIDNIVGILHIKDVTNYLIKYDKNNFNLQSVIREPFFVPTSKKADELFGEMQKNKVHMSIIIDEYGGTAGIVTMEDLIEEIMGNILDEYDEEEKPNIDVIDEDTYTIDGTTGLKDVSECLGIEFPVDEYDTMSGFIIGQLGRIPNEDEHSEIEYSDFIFKIEKIEEKRISLVKAIRVTQVLNK